MWRINLKATAKMFPVTQSQILNLLGPKREEKSKRKWWEKWGTMVHKRRGREKKNVEAYQTLDKWCKMEELVCCGWGVM